MSILTLCLRVVDCGLWILKFLRQILAPFIIPRAFLDKGKNDGGRDEEGQDGKEKAEEIEEVDQWKGKATEVEAKEDEIPMEHEQEDENENNYYSQQFESNPRRLRTPFTSLSQVDADLALARRLQEQERAYMLLAMRGTSDSAADDFVGYDTGSEIDLYDEDDEDDDFSEEQGTIGDGDYSESASDGRDTLAATNSPNIVDDEAYAWELQDEEQREAAVRLLALAGIRISEDIIEHPGNSQDPWMEVDPDELTYEELLALGDVVGTEGRGLSSDTITSLPSINYQAASADEGTNEQCVVCRLDFNDDESLVILPCKHLYHPECINQWLQINKVCPICGMDVSTNLHPCTPMSHERVEEPRGQYC